MIVLKTCFKVQSLNYINIPDSFPFVFDLNHDIEMLQMHQIKTQVDEKQIITQLLFKINDGLHFDCGLNYWFNYWCVV